MNTKTCPQCNTEYNPNRPKQKFCSKACAGASYQRLETRTCERDLCQTTFEVGHASVKKYCSRSCSAIVNNSKTPKRPPGPYSYKGSVCPECLKPKSKNSTYCRTCAPEMIRCAKIVSWLNGTWAGGSDTQLSRVVRDYLLKQADYSCQKCSVRLFHPDDGASILEVNHIDGDGSNHRPENLEVICPNCHAMTSSYRGRNIGNGRSQYYVRIAK